MNHFLLIQNYQDVKKMTIQLTGKNETPELYKAFLGEPRLMMYRLVNGRYQEGIFVDSRRLGSAADVIERRLNAPDDVISTWQMNDFFTSDTSVADARRGYLVVLDAQLFARMTPGSELYRGALVLPTGAWDDLKKLDDKVLYLTGDEVQRARGRGYVSRDGWEPANEVVRKVYEGTGNFPGLLRGRVDPKEYARMVSENCQGKKEVMKLFFNQDVKGNPTMRSWTVNRMGNASSLYGDLDLRCLLGLLVGVADKHS